MTDTELRRLLADAPPEPPMGSGFVVPASPARRAWLLPALAAVVVVVIVAGALASRTPHRATLRTGSTAQPTLTRPPVVSPPEPPAGEITVSYFGIDIDVPRRFVIGPAFCYAPTRDAVVPFTFEAASCPARAGDYDRRRAPYTTVSLAAGSQVDGVSRYRPTTVAGMPARIGTAASRTVGSSPRS